MNSKRSNVEAQELKELLADRADLASLKADLRNLYRRLRERGRFSRTETVKREVFRLLELYRALPV